MDKRVIEIANVDMAEYCLLDLDNKTTIFYREPKDESFTGLHYKGMYFRRENLFFALYPTENGPMAYYQGKEYAITPNLDITLIKNGDDRLFSIKDYGLNINYKRSPYIGINEWSEEVDVDLFYRIEQEYKTEVFNKMLTKPAKE